MKFLQILLQLCDAPKLIWPAWFMDSRHEAVWAAQKLEQDEEAKRDRSDVAPPAAQSGNLDNIGREFEFGWRFYALSASEDIFRARTYSHITYSVR